MEYILPTVFGMGIGTQPNFIDALPNNHGLTLPNKKWRGSLPFNGHLSLIGACVEEGGVSRINVFIFDLEMIGMQMDIFKNSIDMLLRTICYFG